VTQQKPSLRKPSVYLVMHGEGSYDSYGESAVGIFTTLEGAVASLHRSMKVHNKDGSVSFRKGDTRPQVLTLDGCDTIYEHLLDSTDEPKEVGG